MYVTRMCAQVILSLVLLMSVPTKPMNMPAMGKRELLIVGGVAIAAVGSYGLYRLAQGIKSNNPIEKLKTPKQLPLKNALIPVLCLAKRYEDDPALTAEAMTQYVLLKIVAESYAKDSLGADYKSAVEHKFVVDGKSETFHSPKWVAELICILQGKPSELTGDNLSKSYVDPNAKAIIT